MNTHTPPQTVSLAVTGASGIQYALRLLECLVASDCQVYLMFSKPAQVVMSMETDVRVSSRPADAERQFTEMYNAQPGQIRAFGRDQWTAPVASGSGVADAMVVCPCTTGTLSAIACGNSNSLIERAADVCLKEGRKLILLPRETPFSVIHLENMLKLARLGAVILPPNPGFYQKPQTLDDMIDFIVARVLDQLGIAHDLMPRWGIDPPRRNT
ncbi:MAG TPA: aromatic acid decarboxylase [Gammaproteobacteria bacterium]|nr:aromatic acid decarboxylase [Gammaproteobacteria bacterium]